MSTRVFAEARGYSRSAARTRGDSRVFAERPGFGVGAPSARGTWCPSTVRVDRAWSDAGRRLRALNSLRGVLDGPGEGAGGDDGEGREDRRGG